MLQPGETIEKYEVLGPIAAGGMGVVYRVRHRQLQQVVALKMLASHLALDDRVRQRFSQEAWVQAQLQHPNIVSVRDFVEAPGQLGFVMDLVDGPSLEQVITRERPGPWSLDQAMAVMGPVLEAVTYAHARGIVHRDLKPANVLLERSDDALGLGTPRITDFGLAKVLASTQGVTRTGTVMGTVPYMAPEQFRGSTQIDTKADVFALGMMLWRLLTGNLPVPPEDMMACTELYSGRQTMTWPASSTGVLTAAVRAEVSRALSIDPQGRQGSAGDLLQALTAAVRVPTAAPVPAQPSSAPPPAADIPLAQKQPAAPPKPLRPTPVTQPSDPDPPTHSRPAWAGVALTVAALMMSALAVGLITQEKHEPVSESPQTFTASPSQAIERTPPPSTPAPVSPPPLPEPQPVTTPQFQDKATSANPSFDCAKAGTADEHMLCSDARLAALDRAMSELYWKVYPLVKQSSANRAKALKANQKGWLTQRTACATGSASEAAKYDCIDALYEERMRYLVGYR